MKITKLTSERALNKRYDVINDVITKLPITMPACMRAETVEFHNHMELAHILKSVSDDPNQCLMFDCINDETQHYNIASDELMRNAFGNNYDKRVAHQDVSGEWYVSRNVSAFTPAPVVCLDKDSCIGFEHQTISEFMQAVNYVSGNRLDGVGYVSITSNSNRVGLQSNNAHIYMITEGGNKRTFLKNLSDRLTLAGYYHQPSDKTPLDKSVGAPVRLFYDGAPVSVSPLINVIPADIRVLPGTTIDTTTVSAVSSEDVRKMSGRDRSNTGKTIYGVITDDTPIQLQRGVSRGQMVRWSDPFIQNQPVGSKLRCQIPDCVRTESVSWNGVIHKLEDGSSQLYDNGDDQRYAVRQVIWRQLDVNEMFGAEAAIELFRKLVEPASSDVPDFGFEPIKSDVPDFGFKPIKSDVPDFGFEPIKSDVPSFGDSFKFTADSNDKVFDDMVEDLKGMLSFNAPQLIFTDVVDVAALKHSMDRVYMNNNKYVHLNSQDSVHEFVMTDGKLLMKSLGIRFNVNGMGAVEGVDGEKDRAALVKMLTNVVCEFIRTTKQRKMIELQVDMFAKKDTIDLSDLDKVVLSRRFSNFDNVPDYVPELGSAIVDDFNKHTQGFFEHMLDFIVNSRFSPSRRTSNLMLEATSSFGKSLMMSKVLGDLGLTNTVDVKELMLAANGAPSGLSADAFAKSWCTVVEESTHIPAVIKSMDDSFEFSPKMKMKMKVQVYSKFFVSADPMREVSSGSADVQFLNRFNYARLEGILTNRPLFEQDQVNYIEQLKLYACYRLKARIEEFRAMGRKAAGNSASKGLERFHEMYKLNQVVSNLWEETSLPAIDELKSCIRESVPVSADSFGIRGLEPGKCVFKGSADERVNEFIGKCLVPDRGGKAVAVLKHNKVIDLWMKAHLSDSEYKTVQRGRGAYVKEFGKKSTMINAQGKKVSGIVIRR